MPSPTVIEVSGLRKAYGATVAVADVSFEVLEGEIFGLLGPNGAGKTTTMECVEGVRRADAGTIRVLGMDPQRDATSLQKRIGVQLQESQLQKRIKVWEAVDAIATACRRHGKPWGTVPAGAEYAARCVEKGCRMLTLANETLALRRGVEALKQSYAAFF